MSNGNFTWLSIEGRTIIREIIEARLPQWTSGPRESQLECWQSVLAKVPTVLIAPTGWGKTAAFYGPILVMQELLKHPKPNVPPPPRFPIALIVTPLIELGNAHAREMTQLGLRAVSITAEALHDASEHGRNLIREVRECKWSIVLLSAERLTSKDIDEVIRDELFRENLVLLGIDEAHLLVPWGQEFRQAYLQIFSLSQRLPQHTVLMALSATLALGRETNELFAKLNLKEGRFRCIRLSCERPNVRMIFKELTHTLGGYQFPDIAWTFKRGVKAVIYCRTLDLCFRVAFYGWNLYPAGVRRLDNVRLWTSVTSPSYNTRTLDLFEHNPDTSVIVASIAFGMGMNLRNITDSINLGLPASLAALLQQNGRAGRDLNSAAQGWTYIENAPLSALRTTLQPETAPSNKKPNNSKAKVVPKSKPPTVDIEANLQRVVIAHIECRCLIAETNIIMGNPGSDSRRFCPEAKRPYPCSNCLPFWENPSPRPMPSNFFAKPAPTSAAEDPPAAPTQPLHPPLSKVLQANAQAWLENFAVTCWAAKDNVVARSLPPSYFWSGTTLSQILDNFHLMRSRESVNITLQGWKFLQTDGDALFELISVLSTRYDEHIKKQKQQRVQKAAATRVRNKAEQSKDKENIPLPNIGNTTPSLKIRIPARPLKVATPDKVLDSPTWEPPNNLLQHFNLGSFKRAPPDGLPDERNHKRQK